MFWRWLTLNARLGICLKVRGMVRGLVGILKFRLSPVDLKIASVFSQMNKNDEAIHLGSDLHLGAEV